MIQALCVFPFQEGREDDVEINAHIEIVAYIRLQLLTNETTLNKQKQIKSKSLKAFES